MVSEALLTVPVECVHDRGADPALQALGLDTHDVQYWLAQSYVMDARAHYAGWRDGAVRQALDQIVGGAPPYVAPYNEKVKANLFDLPAVVSCIFHCPYCYAYRAERRFWRTAVSRMRNLLWTFSPHFEDVLVGMLRDRRNRYVRLHSAGDFYSSEYFDRWVRIAQRLPDMTFWVYTKRLLFVGEYTLCDKPANLRVIHSELEIKHRPPSNAEVDEILAHGFDQYAWVADGRNVRGDCPAVEDHNIKCVKDCRRCSDGRGKVVGFTKH